MGSRKIPASSIGYAESTSSPGRHHSLDISYLLDRDQKQNVDVHSIFQGSLVLAQGIAGCLYLLPAKNYHSTPSIKIPVSHFFSIYPKEWSNSTHITVSKQK